MPHKGIFIVLEGIDGTGKSTLSKALAAHFAALGREVVLDREPTDGYWGKKLRDSATTGRLSPEEELECFHNDRKEHVSQRITPSLSAGKVVILDRYYFSTMAYQGARGFDPQEIRRINEEFAPVPDYLFLLDLDIESAILRIGSRGDEANHFEKKDALQKCRDIFLSLKDEPFAYLLDASLPAEQVYQTALSHITL